VIFGARVELWCKVPEEPDPPEVSLVPEFVMPVPAVVVTTTEGGAMTRVTVGVWTTWSARISSNSEERQVVQVVVVVMLGDESEMAVTKGCQRREAKMTEKIKCGRCWRVSTCHDGEELPFSD
jgi:hypothetical protein